MFLMYDMHAKAVNCGHLCMAYDMHVQIIGPDVLGFLNFTTLVKITNWASMITKIPNLVHVEILARSASL